MNNTVKSLKSRSFWEIAAVLSSLFLIALLPRLTYETLFTYDETILWYGRTENFYEAIANGNWEETLVAYHPGVTTTWLSSMGLALDHWLFGLDHANEDLLQYVAILRLPLAIFHTLCICFGFLYLRRLFDFRVAYLGSIFWALSPFVIAQSQIIHTDAMVMSTTVLSFLSALIAFRFDESIRGAVTVNWGWLIVSGLWGGLAVLSKLNGWFVALIILSVVLNARVLTAEKRYVMFGRSFIAGMLWISVVLVVFFGLWPVMWVNPSLVLKESFQFGVEVAAAGHDNYYLGTATSNPAFHYYFITWLLRSLPLEIFGLTYALFVVLRKPNRRQHQLIFHFLFFVLIFIVILSLQPKKFDRYILPIYPIMAFIAAYGWVKLVAFGLRWWQKQHNVNLLKSIYHKGGIWIGTSLTLFAFVMLYAPHFMLYYNPLFGGGAVAQQLILVGWGEGLEQAANFISNDAEEICDVRIVTTYKSALLQPRFPNCVQIIDADRVTLLELNPKDYYIIYISMLQRFGEVDPIIDHYLSSGNLLHTVRIHGIDVAYVYSG